MLVVSKVAKSYQNGAASNQLTDVGCVVLYTPQSDIVLYLNPQWEVQIQHGITFTSL
jgi:hypothetical protein